MSTVCVPDHPAIRNAERTGYESGSEPRVPVCPVCGAETDTFYRVFGEVIGCDHCVEITYAWSAEYDDDEEEGD